MCYSAQVHSSYKKYVRMFGAHIDIHEFARLYLDGLEGRADVKTAKGMDAMFAEPQADDEREVRSLIERRNAVFAEGIEQEIFQQRKRKADAERKLETKVTKAATEDVRIAGNKIQAGLRWIEDLKRTELKDRDHRIFPGWYAPVMIAKEGEYVIVPMRYRCRLPGWTEAMEKEKDGTYNARRNRLGTVWRKLFGYRHGVMVIDTFYEHVKREGRQTILRFNPNPGQPLLAACLWNRTTAPGEPELLSFAAITDDPPPEVAAAGHDRCIIPIKPEHVDAWLNPDPSNLDALYAILDDRVRPYYEHEIDKAA